MFYHKSGRYHSHTRQFESSHDDASYIGEAGIELASDIEIAAEHIRRERILKREDEQQQQEAEAALMGSPSQSRICRSWATSLGRTMS